MSGDADRGRLYEVGGEPARRGASVQITDARVSTSAEMSTRVRRYTITMAFRTACFLAMLVVSGPFRWVLLAGAVFLPYIAVILANQANSRTDRKPVRAPDRVDAPAITAGEHVEVVSGTVVSDTVIGGTVVDGPVAEAADPDQDRVA